MEPQQIDLPHTLCPKCNNFILTSNFIIHEARCKGNNLQSSTYVRNSQINKQRNSNARENGKKQEQQRIPCPYCGYGQAFAQLDTHPNTCPHRQVQCSLCHMKFPLSLMDQHQIVCPSRQRSLPSRQQQLNRNNSQRNLNFHNQNRPADRQQNRDYEQNRSNQVYPELRSYRNNEQRRPNMNNNYRIRQNQNYRFQPVRPIQPQFQRNRIYQDQQQFPHGQFRIIDRSRVPNNFLQLMLGGFQINRPSNQSFERRMRVVMFDPGQLIAMLARRAHGSQHLGLTKQQVNKFPITKYKSQPNKKNEQQDMCAICFCNFQEGEDCMNLSCKHKFHPQCIGKWLQKNPTCPLCKKNFKGRNQQGQRLNGHNSQQENVQIPMFHIHRINFN